MRTSGGRWRGGILPILQMGALRHWEEPRLWERTWREGTGIQEPGSSAKLMGLPSCILSYFYSTTSMSLSRARNAALQ